MSVLAETPPATTKVLRPVCFSARLHLISKVSAIASVKPLAISAFTSSK